MSQMCGMKPPDVKGLQHELKRLCIDHCIMERNVDMAKAGLEVRESELVMEDNAYRKNAISAKMSEMEAWISAENVRLEISGINMFNLTMQMDALLGMEPEIMLPRDKMPGPISGYAPGIFMPPPPPRL
jgi:hypothetical protein